MAKIATAAVSANRLLNIVKVIPKRSTEVVVGIGKYVHSLIVTS